MRSTCARGEPEFLRYLLTHPEVCKYINRRYVDGKNQISLLQEIFLAASLNPNQAAVQYIFNLLDPDCNEIGVDKYCILEYACRSGFCALVQKLVRRHSIPAKVWGVHLNILNAVCRQGNLDMLQYPVRSGYIKPEYFYASKEAALREVMYNGHTEMLRYLVDDLKINSEALVPFMTGAVTYACRNGWLDMLRHLVDVGCTQKQARGIDNQAVLLVCTYGHADILEYLTTETKAGQPGAKGWRLGLKDLQKLIRYTPLTNVDTQACRPLVVRIISK